MRIRTILLPAATAVLLACGGGGPSGPSGGGPTGTFEGVHTFTIASAGQTIVLTCQGDVVVARASGGQIRGSIAIDPCAALDGAGIPAAPFSGTLAADGSIAFILLVQAAIVEGLRQEGCEVARIDERFAGQIDEAAFSAALTADIVCPGTGPLTFRWDVQASR